MFLTDSRPEFGWQSVGLEVIAMALHERDYGFFNDNDSNFRFWFSLSLGMTGENFEDVRTVINMRYFARYVPKSFDDLFDDLQKILHPV